MSYEVETVGFNEVTKWGMGVMEGDEVAGALSGKQRLGLPHLGTYHHQTTAHFHDRPYAEHSAKLAIARRIARSPSSPIGK